MLVLGVAYVEGKRLWRKEVEKMSWWWKNIDLWQEGLLLNQRKHSRGRAWRPAHGVERREWLGSMSDHDNNGPKERETPSAVSRVRTVAFHLKIRFTRNGAGHHGLASQER